MTGAGREENRAQNFAARLQERTLQHGQRMLGTALFTDSLRTGRTQRGFLTSCLRGISAVVGEITPRIPTCSPRSGEMLFQRSWMRRFTLTGWKGVHVDSQRLSYGQRSEVKWQAVDVAADGGNQPTPLQNENLKPMLDAGKVPVMGGSLGR